jgi:nitrite reductase/ring-hydroxylating ferredoxin subunit
MVGSAVVDGRLLLGKRSDLPDGTRRIVSSGGQEVGVIVHGGEIFAYRNQCLHQGGPVCEGEIIGRVEAVLTPDNVQTGERFSETELHLVCPWHGWEYDLRTGVCATDARFRLRRHEVVIEGDDVYLVVDA